MLSRKGLLPKGIGDRLHPVRCTAYMVASRKGLLPKGIGDLEFFVCNNGPKTSPERGYCRKALETKLDHETNFPSPLSRKGLLPKGIGDMKTPSMAFL